MDNRKKLWTQSKIYILEMMVFCSELMGESIVLVIEKSHWQFEAEDQEFAKFLKWLEHFNRERVLKQNDCLTFFWGFQQLQ